MIFLFRMLMLGVMAILWLIAGLAVCLCRPKHRGNVYCLTQMLKLAQWVLGVKVTYRIKPELRDLMPAVFVGNHQSNWDIVTMAEIPQPGLVCVGKKSLIYAPVFGILFYLSGNILIDRANAKKTGGDFLTIVNRIKKNGLSIWMFPEGHRSKGQGMLPFKTGAVHTAALAGVPIIPFVTSSYAGQIKLNRWNNGEIIVEMLDPIDLSNLPKSEYKQATRDLRTKMMETLKRIDTQAKRPGDFVLPKYDEVE